MWIDSAYMRAIELQNKTKRNPKAIAWSESRSVCLLGSLSMHCELQLTYALSFELCSLSDKEE